MRKTNRNIKRVKFVQRILIFALVQVAIISVFILTTSSAVPISEDELIYETIVVENKETTYFSKQNKNYCFISNDTKYYIPTLSVWASDGFSRYEVYETVNIGDVLEIGYIEGSNRLCSIKKNNQKLLTLEGYNRTHTISKLTASIVFIFVELLFLTVLTFFVLINYGNIKIKKRKKRQKAILTEENKSE